MSKIFRPYFWCWIRIIFLILKWYELRNTDFFKIHFLNIEILYKSRTKQVSWCYVSLTSKQISLNLIYCALNLKLLIIYTHAYSCSPGFLNLDAIDILDQIILCLGAVLSFVGCLAAALEAIYWIPLGSSSFNNQKSLQTLPHVFWGQINTLFLLQTVWFWLLQAVWSVLKARW